MGNDNQELSEFGIQTPADGVQDEQTGAAELQKIKEERDSLYDRLLRKQADFENYKKRVERERSEVVQYASAELMKELLNALDSFDRAIHNASIDERTLR